MTLVMCRSKKKGVTLSEHDPLVEVMPVWKTVLGIEDARPDDNFFNFGGHSLTALDLVVELEQRYGVSIPLRDFFGNPTPAGLASLILEASPGIGRPRSG
jgi:acyl carrier protein